MLSEEQMRQFLNSLAATLPNKAPDFSKADVMFQWHRALKEHLQTRDQCRAVLRVLTTKYDFFPTPRQIIGAIAEKVTEHDVQAVIHQREQARLRYENASDRCHLCNNSGQIAAKSKKDGAEYGFKCGQCDAAERFGLSRHMPTYDLSMDATFERPMFANKRRGW